MHLRKIKLVDKFWEKKYFLIIQQVLIAAVTESTPLTKFLIIFRPAQQINYLQTTSSVNIYFNN